ncbi:MAG: hypothetical protein Q7O66_10470 [Dehalococcoidia bacterium]|nr:hypothetical protein [Dehalococcoidia bacterium]
MPAEERTMVREVNLTTARNLSPIFDEVVRKEHPVMIVRGCHERGLLVSRETLLRVLNQYEFHVDLLPEDDDSFTLWLKELETGGTGRTLPEARQDLLSSVRSYVRNYLQQFDFNRHLPYMARQEPHVLRLSLAKNDSELIEMIFGRSEENSAAA